MARELFASESIGPGLVVRESQLTGSSYDAARLISVERYGVAPPEMPHLVFTPTSGTYSRLDRAEVERLHEELGRWLGR